MDGADYKGPERRSGTPLSTALSSIIDLQAEVEDLGRVVSSTRETQDQAQRKIFLLGVAIVAVLGVFVINFATLQNVRSAVNATKTTATTLNDCLLVGGSCYGELAARGTQGSVRQMKFQACVLAYVPEARTAERIITCGQQAYPEIGNLGDQLREVLK